MKKQVYLSPQMEVLEVALEQGFALSESTSTTINDWEVGNF